MSTWVIVSWVGVAILTGINIFVFLKLKKASEQMLKSMFPGMDMSQALGQMQKMMGGMPRGGRAANPFGGGMPQGGDAQLKNAMAMLQRMQQQQKKK